MPRTPRRILALLLAGATLASLASCAPAAPAVTDVPSASPEATQAPIFASDEEALAAAVAAYEAYSNASSLVGQDGGGATERISPFVSKQLFEQVSTEFSALRDAGLRIEGTPRIFGAKLASADIGGETAKVSAYFCRDVTMTRVLLADGTDVTPEGRIAVQPLLAHLISSPVDKSLLIVDQIERWSDDSFCS